MSCSRCGGPVDIDWDGLCQICWEAYCDEQWWKMFEAGGGRPVLQSVPDGGPAIDEQTKPTTRERGDPLQKR